MILSWCCFVRLNLLKNVGSLSFALADLEEMLKREKTLVSDWALGRML